jgi:hypothetical protein
MQKGCMKGKYLHIKGVRKKYIFQGGGMFFEPICTPLPLHLHSLWHSSAFDAALKLVQALFKVHVCTCKALYKAIICTCARRTSIDNVAMSTRIKGY